MRDEATNREHARNPVAGDYWHEMLCPIMVVLDVTPTHVVICDKTKEINRDYWTWDVMAIKTLTREAFALKPHYDTPQMAHKFHCDVLPAGHADIARIYAASQLST